MSPAPTCTRNAFSLLFFLCIFSISLNAQRTINGSPMSFNAKFKQLIPKVATTVIPSLDMQKIKREDSAMPGTNRYAAPVATNYTLENSGTWTDLPDGGRIWKLKIEVKKTLGISVLFKNFFLPNGSRLFMYTEDGSKVLGAYSSLNNLPHEKFMIGMIEAETVILEYFEPRYSKGKGRFEIYQVMLAYHPERMKSDYEFQTYTGFGSALDCHQDINCSLGGNWQQQKRGVVRIRTVYTAGLGWCSGSLINNTNNDGKPYVLTANHCGNPTGFSPDYSLWRFDFNFEFPTCASTDTEPDFTSILSCESVANREESDFLLLRMFSYVPDSYNAFYNGWDRSESLPSKGTLLHHPAGDVKKLSIDNDALNIYGSEIEWDNVVTTPADHHWRSILDIGTMEPGSSGSPLFNPSGRIVGQLHGGNASCQTFITYHGRFNKSWNAGTTPETRLQDWLDPTGSGAMTLDGINAPPAPSSANISGTIIKENGMEVTGVDVIVTGDANLSVNNGADGAYNISNLSIGGSFSVSPIKDDLHSNGVTTFDLVLMRKKILGVDELSPYKMIAADVNNDGKVTTFDVVLTKRVILELDLEFTSVPAWKFIPADFEFQDPSDPLGFPYPEIDPFSPLVFNVEGRDYIAIKMGDINDTAD